MRRFGEGFAREMLEGSGAVAQFTTRQGARCLALVDVHPAVAPGVAADQVRSVVADHAGRWADRLPGRRSLPAALEAGLRAAAA